VETDTAPVPAQRPVPEFSDSRPKKNASSDHGEREQTSLSSSDRIDRHIVTSYQITRGEVCISSSSTTVKNLSQDIQERILCEVNGGGCSSSSSSCVDGSEAAEEAQLGGGLARELRQQVKEGIYRLLSEGSEASSLGQYIMPVSVSWILTVPTH
jgi:hypothetical protein